MSPSLYGISVALVLLVVFCQTGTSIKCWECDSFRKERCGNPTVVDDPLLLVQCPVRNNKTALACRKIEQSIFYDKEDHARTFRSCAYTIDEKEGCKERIGTHRFKSFYCNCRQDGCNAASSLALPTALLAAAFGLLHFLKHL